MKKGKIRDCPDGYIIARNIEEAIYYLRNYNVHNLSHDHDLGEDGEGNLLPPGYDLVKYICENGLRAEKIYLHTDNGVGRQNICKRQILYTFKGHQFHEIIFLRTI
ncbi:cyclic-phosphate processing receiver domain-containing protein [Gottfriedia solisilvae]|uniref:Cyclic-phosphate processing Receiver domain-containing protein n=1 Tax=Gottfriedia solisilvae TaxID=1516104 RepID=A0A8J3AKD4_9BACI|nr:cyclic-phosphate processing receiver domain-containing protein [Gottfriedia solisilvae]GGI11683.1 hypothetical protein GCM10007380_09070 [Gottfriedia solisilvae]